ncbi:MAG: hypothetical protein HOP96_06700 [Sphingomonas sp.]|nr:hypothetical protein [Sphingomonas sp.]
MSAPVRFLFVAVAGWALFRGVSMGMLPGAEAFTIARAEAAPTPLTSTIVPTEFPPIEPVPPVAAELPSDAAAYSAYAPYGTYPPAPPMPPRNAAAPVYYYPAAAASRTVTVPLPPVEPPRAEPDERPLFYGPIPQLEDWDIAQVARRQFSEPARQSIPAPASVPQFIPQRHLDRLQLSAWALLRGQAGGSPSLASGGTLGGSQAGARLTYAIDRRIAASLRSTSAAGGSRGGEVAAGIRLTPIPSIPVSITAERRQAIGKFSNGRSAFALFAEGGVYQQPLGWNLLLDGYAQAGVVGIRSRDIFADGGLIVSRPVWGRFSAGLGLWGGYQPGLYRIDAGPRVSMRVRPNINVHLDWRQRLAGTAQPGSGPAVTLGANF